MVSAITTVACRGGSLHYLAAYGGAGHAQTLILVLTSVLPTTVKSVSVIVSTRWLLAWVLKGDGTVAAIMMVVNASRSPTHQCVLLDGRHRREVILEGGVGHVLLLSNGLAVSVGDVAWVTGKGMGSAASIDQVRRDTLFHLLLHRLLVKLV